MKRRKTKQLALTLSAVLASSLIGCSKTKVLGAHETEWKQKELIITYSCSAPPTNETVKNAVAEHFNLIPNAEETLDLAQKSGIKVMLEHGRLTPKVAKDTDKLKELGAVIDRVKNYPALEGYYLFDEPKADAIPKLAKIVEFVRERDPKHYCFINMLPVYGVPGYAVPIEPGVDPSKTYMKFIKKYIEEVKPDLLSYDFYMFHKNQNGEPEDLAGYFANLSLIRDAAKSAEIPFINIIQACAFDDTFRVPNENELRWQVYTTLAYGGRGISYFLYWGPTKYGGIYQDGKPNKALLEPIVELNKELKALSPIMMTLDSEEVYNSENSLNGKSPIPEKSPVQVETDGKYVLGLFSTGNKINHFMLVNTNYKDSEVVKVKLQQRPEGEPPVDAVQFNPKANAWEDVVVSETGILETELAPGDGRLFRIE